MLNSIAGDVRYALRAFLRMPVTSGMVALMLGIALAANITLFNVIDTTVLGSSHLR